MTLPAPSSYANYRGDVRHIIIGEVKGPNLIDELLTAVERIWVHISRRANRSHAAIPEEALRDE